jgi:chemotaxis protein CheD
MGELYIAAAPTILTTSSIGSCVAICVYSQVDRIGALAHIMLPHRPESTEPVTTFDYKFADVAFDVIIKELEKNNIMRSRLTIKMIGGANMFPDVQGRSHKIGEKNIEASKALVQQYGVRLVGEETGGNSGRALTFDLSNGIVTIKITI